jgi:bifunctional non-homologous end joining protein LigD
VSRDPKRVTTEGLKVERKGRLFLDWMRNGYSATVVSAFGVRAADGAPVSMPVEWAEIDERGFNARRYTIKNALKRIEAGDPWEGWRRRARSLAKAAKILEKLRSQ